MNFKELTKKLMQKNYEIRIFKGEKSGRKRRKIDMPATKVAGLAQNNSVFNTLAAELKKELHGEKMRCPVLTEHLLGL